MPPKPKQMLSRIGSKVKRAVVIGGIVGASAIAINHMPNKSPVEAIKGKADSFLVQSGIKKSSTSRSQSKPQSKSRSKKSKLKDLAFDVRPLMKPVRKYSQLTGANQRLEVISFMNHLAPKLGLEPNFMLKMVRIESNYDYMARSKVNAKGLMQVTDIALVEIKKHVDFKKILGFEPSPKDLYNPYVNLVVGTYFFKHLVNVYGNVNTALIVYNIGPGNYRKMLKGDLVQKGAANRYVAKHKKAQP